MRQVHVRLREARTKAGLTSARNAALHFGWPVPTYAAHENGSRGFRADALTKYAKAFHVTPEWLMLGHDWIEKKGRAEVKIHAAPVDLEADLLVSWRRMRGKDKRKLTAIARALAGRVRSP
jgi:transcriptional regulator with XRE-family HTH domain